MAEAPWFFAPAPWATDEIVLSGEESHHALRVMRVEPPDVLTVFDGAGNLSRCAAARVENDRLVVEVLERETRRRPRPEIAVYQGAAKGNKVDEVIERLAELGTAETWVYQSARAVARWDRAKIERLEQRWDSIARSAAKQSRNPFVLKGGGGLSWTELVRRVAREPFAIVLWEEAELPMRTALSGSADRIALVVGPEGGLTRAEAEELATAGAQLVSLGPQILRTENAPVVAVAALMYHFGAIG